MSKLKSIVAGLAKQAEDNAARAYAILGARPGPGIDLLIEPEQPLCGKWYVIGKTAAGEAFVKKFWSWQPLSNQKVAEMKKQATDWALTFRTNYPILSLAEADDVTKSGSGAERTSRNAAAAKRRETRTKGLDRA